MPSAPIAAASPPKRPISSGAPSAATITVTKNGLPVAVLRPYGPQDPAAYPFRTDPMGTDEAVPTFSGDPGFSEQVDDLLAGFGSDD